MIRIYLRPSGLHRHVATMLCLHVAASGFKSHAALPDNPTQAMAAHLTPLPVAPNVNWTDEVRMKLSSNLSLMKMAEVESAIGAENLLRKGLVDDRAGQHRRTERLVQITDVGAAAQTKLFYRLILL